MPFCAACKSIRIQRLPDPSEPGFKHCSAANLPESARTCPLCSLMKASFLKVDAFHQPPDVVERNLESYGDLPLRLWAVRKDASRRPDGGANLIAIEVGIREKRFRGRFDVYATRESLASLSGDVYRKAPARAGDSLETFDLLKLWVQECVSNHDLCRKSLNGDFVDDHRPVLPSRLIDVGCHSRPPRLILSDGGPEQPSVSPYVTLSHCWGPPEKRPIQSTQATFHQYIHEIPLDEMPKTFQDAISICRNLDIPYLWVDSLCIIQDDEDDWRQQSVIMGAIYEGAWFTIAASSATNSSQGLFMDNFELDSVEIPYYDHLGSDKGVIVAYLRQDLERILNSSPLNQRAWVMQEYLLSRRTLHFTKNAILWSCKNTKTIQQRLFQSEYGDEWVVVHDYPVWSWLVTSYTKRELTIKSDKLIAMEGLRGQFGKKTGNTYAYGLWLEEMPEDLFWHGEAKLRRDVGNDIPSWSWASTTGEIFFKLFDEPQRICGPISLDETKPGQLVIPGLIKEAEEFRGPMACQAFSIENLERMDFTGGLHDEYKDGNLLVAPTFLLVHDAKKVGWFVFDEFESCPGPIWCLPLLKQHVWEWYASSEEHFYWILALRYSTPDNAYVRVGWGLVLRTAWFEDVLKQEIKIA